MLQITTNRIDGKNRTLDLHQVKIPGSGVRAVQLPQPDLYRAIKDMVPGLASTMGWQELCLRLGVYLEQQREAAEAECQ
jgi:hypothetical protein